MTDDLRAVLDGVRAGLERDGMSGVPPDMSGLDLGGDEGVRRLARRCGESTFPLRLFIEWASRCPEATGMMAASGVWWGPSPVLHGAILGAIPGANHGPGVSGDRVIHAVPRRGHGPAFIPPPDDLPSAPPAAAADAIRARALISGAMRECVVERVMGADLFRVATLPGDLPVGIGVVRLSHFHQDDRATVRLHAASLGFSDADGAYEWEDGSET